MKKIWCMFLLMTCMCLGMLGMTDTAWAATGAVVVSVSSENVNIGDEVTITATAVGPEGERADAAMTVSFDPAMFEFVSCSAVTYEGGVGGSILATTDTFTVTIKAVATGTCTVSLTGENGVVFDSEENLDSMTGSSVSVTVNNAVSDEPADDSGNEPGDNTGNEPGDEPGDDSGNEPGDDTGNEPGDEPGDDSGNEPGDNTGNEPGDEPGDDAGNEPGDEPDDDTGNEPGDEPGDDTGNEPGGEPGNDSGDEPGDNTGEEPPAIKLSDDNSLSILKISSGTLSPEFYGPRTKYTATVEHDITNITVTAIPVNQKAEVVSVTGNTNLAVGTNLVSIVVRAENGATATYKIEVTRKEAEEPPAQLPEDEPSSEQPNPPETEDGTVILYHGENYVITLALPEGVVLPDGFVKASVVLENEESFAAYRDDREGGEANFYLFYGINSEGAEGWYRYDAVEGTYQRADINSDSVDESLKENMTYLQNEYNSLVERYNKEKSVSRSTIAVLVFLMAVLVIIIINLLLYIKGRKAEKNNDEDDEIEDFVFVKFLDEKEKTSEGNNFQKRNSMQTEDDEARKKVKNPEEQDNLQKQEETMPMKQRKESEWDIIDFNDF